MKITLTGAAGGEVTGSCYSVQTEHARILVDCGLFQGGKKSEALNRPPTTPNRRLDAVLLTHGHLDHTGRLPLLAKMGYSGPVYGTPATLDMTGLILRDAARLQVADNDRQNRKRMRADQPLAGAALHAGGCGGDHLAAAAGAVSKAVRRGAGHQGDLGGIGAHARLGEHPAARRGGRPHEARRFLRRPRPAERADAARVSSRSSKRISSFSNRPTAGAIIATSRKRSIEFVRIVKEAVKSGGKMLVPTFAVGRAQLIMLLLAWMFRTGSR